MPKFSEFFFGKKSKVKKTETLNPQQQQMLSMLMQSLMGGGGPFAGLNQSPEQMNAAFQKGVRDPAMLNFQRTTVPGIMQSFADQGASSGLYQTLGAAGRDLEQNLATQQMQFNQQGLQNLLSALGIGLGTQAFQPYVKEGNPGIVPGAVNAFFQGMGSNVGGGGGGGGGFIPGG